MNKTQIEDWWKHCGCYDRQQAIGIEYSGQENYLSVTDSWWDNLTEAEKQKVYEEFFDEN